MFSHHRNHRHHPIPRRFLIAALIALAFAIWAGTAHGDASCHSPDRYSSAFLHSQTALNDIETLLIETARSPRTAP